MSQLKVLVAGASIAGPTTAYWLAKAGAKVTIIERFPGLRTSGQNIDIRTAGVSVMRKMPGMEAAVRAKNTGEEGISWVRDDGRSYGVLRATKNPDQQSLLSEYEIFRGDLARVLYDLTKDNPNITYIFNEQIASMQQPSNDDDPITVEFTNGLSTSEYDLVVACDGATSRTRAIGLGCGVRTHIKPVNSWAAYFSISEDLLGGSKIGHAISAPAPGRFVAVGPDPSGINRVTLMGINPKNSTSDVTLPFREAQKAGDDALKAYLSSHFTGVGWKTPQILTAMQTSTDFYASEIVQVMDTGLYKGRFAMVGDAGYAAGPTGGGTSLALAGAYYLAGEICAHPGDLAAGLRGYKSRMEPLIKDMQKIPPGVPGIMAPQTQWGTNLRNWIFALITKVSIPGFVSRFFASAFGSTGQFPLGEYEWVS